MLRCQAIVDADRHAVEQIDPLDHPVDTGEPVPSDHSPAMDVVDTRTSRCMVALSQNSHLHIGVAIHSWNTSVLDHQIVFGDVLLHGRHLRRGPVSDELLEIRRWFGLSCHHEPRQALDRTEERSPARQATL